MLDLAMDIPMLLDTTTLARGLPMLSLRQRLMLILLFFMDPIMADGLGYAGYAGLGYGYPY